MRVLMTTDSVGGVWSYTLELCRALAFFNCNVTLACMGGPLAGAARDAAAALPNVSLYESDYRLEWMEEPWEDVQRAADWLGTLVHRSRAELLHLNCYGPALARFDIPVLLVAHSCVHTWWRATRGGDPDAGWRRYRDCVIRALAIADRVVAPTAAHLHAMAECYEEVNLNGRARVIHNGIDATRWSLERRPARFVLGVGRAWDKAKNLDRLAAIAPTLDCPVVIAGEGDLEHAGSARNVIRLGRLPRRELEQYFCRAAAFVHPARYEPFGLAVLEAAICGCPLVLGDIPSLRELWRGAALFVDPEDAHALCRNLDRLLADGALRDSLGRAARERAHRYGAAAMAAAYAKEYQQLLTTTAENVA